MSIINQQNKPIVIGTPIEIEKACNDIRLSLADLSWVSHPYFIAQRFYEDKNGKGYYYPETYCKGENDLKGKYPYHPLTPDSDYTGMFFFMVGTGRTDFNKGEYNFIKYPVSIIFSCNLELIDRDKLESGLFTQELIKSARRIITDSANIYDFRINSLVEDRDLRRVYREFTLNKLEQYNRAPLQCFRFDLEIEIQEECE